MILKNRSSAISITDEDIRKLTERIEVVYVVADDPRRSLHPRTRWPVPDQPGVGTSLPGSQGSAVHKQEEISKCQRR